MQNNPIETEQAKLLYDGMPAALTANIVLAGMLVVVQASVIASGVLLGWLGLLGAAMLARTALWIWWRKHGIHDANRPQL
jgi:ABC-type nickel/cobalt efflux system permease component RcnA